MATAPPDAGPAGAAVGRVHAHNVGQREAPIIQEELLAVAKATGSRAALDLSRVTMMGSLALGTIVAITKECKADGGKLVLFGLSDQLHGLFKMSHLDRLLTIVQDEKAALKKLGV